MERQRQPMAARLSMRGIFPRRAVAQLFMPNGEITARQSTVQHRGNTESSKFDNDRGGYF